MVSSILVMSEMILQLPSRLAAELDAASKESNRRPDEIVLELLRRAMAARQFRALRRQALDQLGDDAPLTDDDAFKMVG